MVAAAGTGRDQVRAELVTLLARSGEAELDALYRVLTGLMGTGIVGQIGETLSRLVREGAVEIETRPRGPEGPFVGIARLVRPGAPPYACICA